MATAIIILSVLLAVFGAVAIVAVIEYMTIDVLHEELEKDFREFASDVNDLILTTQELQTENVIMREQLRATTISYETLKEETEKEA